MLNELSDNYKELSGNYNSMKKENRNYKQEAVRNKKYIIWNKKYTRTNLSRLDEAEAQISELEDKVGRHTQVEQQNEKRFKKYEDSLRELQDNMKYNNIRIIGIPGEEKEQGIENLFEKIMKENFPKLVRKKATQVQEYRGSQSRWKQRGPRQDISQMARFKNKEKILKGSKGETASNTQGRPDTANSWFLNRNIQARREWQEIFHVMKSKGLPPRLLYPVQLSFKMEGEISFPD